MLFETALKGGSQALGVATPGLAEGGFADIVSLDAGNVALAGRSGDAILDSWIFGAGRSLVDCVWARGRKVVQNGRHHARETIALAFSSKAGRTAGRMSFEPKPGVQGAALYQRIRNDLEARIMSGAWPPGHRVPFEHELMETYSCSRMTVNKVLSALAETGLVVRRRRAGSFVSRPRVQSAILQIPDLKAEVEKRGERYGYRLLELHKRVASVHDKARLGVGGRATVLALRCRHEAEGQPFAIEDRLINAAGGAGRAQTGFFDHAAEHLAGRPRALDRGRASHHRLQRRQERRGGSRD